MQKFQPDRAVQILTTPNQIFGTGYRISDRLVLTCAHLFSEDRDCQVKSKSIAGVKSAKVIWKAPDNIDIALLELSEEVETCSPVSFGSLPDSNSAERVKFDFYSWPRWGFVDSESESLTTGLHIWGEIPVADQSANGLLVLQAERTPSILQIERAGKGKSPWQGASGAAIVCNGLVVGVQKWHQNPDRPKSLEAESLARIYNNQEWRELLEKYDIDPEPKPVISVSFKISSYRNQAPPKPSYFVERPEVSVEVKKLLLSEETAEVGTLVISAIYGLGGIGKSTLAAALAQDKAVQDYFPDGIFWATLGQQPDILSFLHGWIQALGDYNFKPTSIDAASLQLRTLLADKKALLVVDDLWNAEDVEPFRVAGAGCKLLVTTREAPVIGAIRYDLDIMTETQSLALLTGYLKHELTLEDQKQAKNLAKIVGYLPLALELTVAQVEDEIPWVELIEELQAEIANLEILDRLEAGDTANEEKRKHYSLIACFNLSLKRLSPQRLQQFIWLGVLPDDVTITEKMAMTLWDCRLTEAKKTLRYLRGKALLLTGVSSEQITNYRVHDLLHDLARNLLQASPHSETDYQLSGLGLSISEAHRQLLTRYQRQTKNALWHSLEDDGYIYNQLIWHLERAEKIAEIHQLLREETPERANGWYSKCEKEGKTAIFIKDVSRAWQLAEADFADNPSQAIALQVRYALINTSLNSLAGNIEPELIALLIQHEIWTPAQGLAYVRQSQDDEKRAKGLRAISPYLTPTLLPEGLELARAIWDECCRKLALKGLARYLPQNLLPEVLDVARAIDEEFYRAKALTELAPYLPASLLPDALEIARTIMSECSRAEALTALAPYLPEALSEALEYARRIANDNSLVEVLTGLAPYLSATLLLEALEITRAIKDEDKRTRALTGLAPYLPVSLLPEASEAARRIGNEYDRAKALTRLASHLRASLFEALDAVRAIEEEVFRAKALTELAPYLSASLLPDALEIARTIMSECSRAEALTALVPYLPEVLPEVLDVARTIMSEYSRAEALTALAPYLPASLLPDALEIARTIMNERSRARALTGLAPYLTEVLLAALVVNRRIGDEYYRALALTALAPYFPEVLPEILKIARAIENECSRARILTALAPHFSEVLPEALEATRGIEKEVFRAEVLTALAPHFPEVLPEALEATRGIEGEVFRTKALTALAPHLPEVLSEALEATRSIDNEYSLAEVLIALAPYLPASLLSEALEIAIAIGDEDNRARALTRLLPYLPASLLPEVLKVTKAIENEYYRAEALGGFAPHLPKNLLPKVLEIARGIGQEVSRAKLLTGLAPYLPEVLSETLEVTRVIGIESFRAKALQELTKVLKPNHVDESLWKKNLHALGTLTRSHFLETIPNLVPLILHFGGVVALREVHQGIREVSRWWK